MPASLEVERRHQLGLSIQMQTRDEPTKEEQQARKETLIERVVNNEETA